MPSVRILQPIALASFLVACTSPGDPLVEAHRGAAGYYPQNSRTAMFQSIEDGFDGIELDLVLTADGVPVLSHDPWVHETLCTYADGRAINERLAIRGFTLAELQSGFLCGGVPDPEHPNAAVEAETPMAFTELVDRLYLDRPEVVVHLDLKFEPAWTDSPDAFAEAVLRPWVEADLPQRFYVSSAFPEMIVATEAWASRAGWDVPTSLSWPPFRRERNSLQQALGFELGATVGTEDAVQAAQASGADGLALQWEVASRAQVRSARRAGLNVQLWTLNDPRALALHAAWPVDALITDYPGDLP